MPYERSYRSRSRSRSPRRRSDRDRRSPRPPRKPIAEGTRLHIANLTPEHRERDVEKVFEKFGQITEVWMAHSPPCFAFVVFKYKEDAIEAMRQMDGAVFYDIRLGVSMAKPRRKGIGGGACPTSDVSKCYNCGEDGHFARDCPSAKKSQYTRPAPANLSGFGTSDYSYYGAGRVDYRTSGDKWSTHGSREGRGL